MTNTILLEEKIEKSGLKKQYIAYRLGIKVLAFRNKCTNKSHFKPCEIACLCDVLNLSADEKEAIFFMP